MATKARGSGILERNNFMDIKIVKDKISKKELAQIAKEQFGDLVKAVVDVRQEIMAIGGELHADEEVFLTEQEGSRREDMWGVNLYPKESGAAFLEFDSMINLKPALGNRTRNVENRAIQEKIRIIIKDLVSE